MTTQQLEIFSAERLVGRFDFGSTASHIVQLVNYVFAASLMKEEGAPLRTTLIVSPDPIDRELGLRSPVTIDLAKPDGLKRIIVALDPWRLGIRVDPTGASLRAVACGPLTPTHPNAWLVRSRDPGSVSASYGGITHVFDRFRYFRVTSQALRFIVKRHAGLLSETIGAQLKDLRDDCRLTEDQVLQYVARLDESCLQVAEFFLETILLRVRETGRGAILLVDPQVPPTGGTELGDWRELTKPLLV